MMSENTLMLPKYALTCRGCILNHLMKLYRRAKMFGKTSSVLHQLSNMRDIGYHSESHQQNNKTVKIFSTCHLSWLKEVTDSLAQGFSLLNSKDILTILMQTTEYFQSNFPSELPKTIKRRRTLGSHFNFS